MASLPSDVFSMPTPISGFDVHLPVPDTPPNDHRTINPPRPLLQTNLSSSSTTTLEKNHEELWQNLTRFYEDNEAVIKRSISADVEAAAKDEKITDVQVAIDTFVDTANVVLEGLVALGNVHPVLGVAIFAFHGVMRLELTRRENNKKVLAVKLQMQNMMCTMFQLRTLKHVHVNEAQREQERSRLQILVKSIADDITKCGSDLNYYTDRKFVSKFINAKVYERRFTDHIETFIQRRSELQNAISAYIAVGMDNANLSLHVIEQKVDAMDRKLDSFITRLFRKLDTSREQELTTFTDLYGGIKECLAKDELLTKFLTKAGENIDDEKKHTRREEALIKYRKDLTRELAENLNEVLKNNLSRFEKLLAVQNSNMERISDHLQQQGYQLNDHSSKLEKLVSTSILILEEGKLIKKAVVPNSKVKLKDPEFQQIWDRMGLKRSVKAKNFVLTFRDHLLSDRSIPPTPLNTGFPSLFGEHSSSLLPEPMTPNHLRTEGDSDLWVFDYIDVQHVQPIVEAMDEDGSGFISVKEANKFALSRPKGMNLLHWMAHWAAGWHINLTYYYHKIYQTMIEMHAVLDDTPHPANRTYIEIYLNYWYFIRIEGVLRSIKILPDDARHEPKLVEIAENMRNLQEQRLLSNLKEMSFLFESSANVLLVTGPGRAEIWILPLIYLLLQRHLDIMKLAKKHVINENELTAHAQSFEYIFSVFDERMRNLEVIFKQVYRETENQFGNHAYGMFYTSFKETTNIPLHNSLFYYRDVIGTHSQESPVSEGENPGPEPKKEDKKEPVDLSILNFKPDDNFLLETPDMTVGPTPPDHTPHPIEGAWIGVCYRASNPLIAYQGSVEVHFAPVVDSNLSGKAYGYLGKLDVQGHIAPSTDVDTEEIFDVAFKLVSPTFTDLWCKGQYNADRDTIRGQWAVPVEGELEDITQFPSFDTLSATPNRLYGDFLITRTPKDVYRYRYFIDCVGIEPAGTIARKRWTFALEAVMFRTKCNMNYSQVIKERMQERARWIELACRDYLDSNLRATRGHLSDEGREALLTLTWTVPPENSLIYERLSVYLYNRMNYHRGLFVCDVCDQRITFDRFVCITCVEEDFSNQVDLCAECIESRSFSQKRSFVHHLSHSLIRATVRLHYCEMPLLITQARELSERVKTSFTVVKSKKFLTDMDQDIKVVKNVENKHSKFDVDPELDNIVTSRPSLTPLICACCNEEVTLPCWACVTCALDTLICLNCELINEPVRPREGFAGVHTRIHPLLRINDSSEIKTTMVEPKTARLERRLTDMEERLNVGFMNRMSDLEEKVNVRLDAIQSKMKATAVEEVTKFLDSTMEEIDEPLVDSHANSLGNNVHDKDQALFQQASSPISPTYDSRIEERLERLEAKVDSQFERIFGLMQQLIASGGNTRT